MGLVDFLAKRNRKSYVATYHDYATTQYNLRLPIRTFLQSSFSLVTKEIKSRLVSSAGHIVEPRKAMLKIAELSGVPFTIHDLRRTFITTAESLDISAYALKRLLNHKMNNDVTSGYIITDVERLRQPMQIITDFLLKAMGINN